MIAASQYSHNSVHFWINPEMHAYAHLRQQHGTDCMMCTELHDMYNPQKGRDVMSVHMYKVLHVQVKQCSIEYYMSIFQFQNAFTAVYIIHTLYYHEFNISTLYAIYFLYSQLR